MILEARSWNQVFGDETVDRARGTEEELVLCLFQLWWLPASFRVWSHHSSLCLHTHHLFFSLISLCCCSVAKSSPTLCDPMDYSMTGFSVLYYPPEFAQTHVHRVSDAIQRSHPLLPTFAPLLNLSQHQDLFQWVGSLHQVAKVLELQLQHQSIQWIFRTDFL